MNLLKIGGFYRAGDSRFQLHPKIPSRLQIRSGLAFDNMSFGVGQRCFFSRSSRYFLTFNPAAKPVRLPLAPISLWQGIIIGIGL